MYYKLITSNKEGDFVIGEDELPKLLEAVNKRIAAVFREGVLINPNMAISLVIAKDRMEDVRDSKLTGMEFKAPSPFAKLLSSKMKMLSDQGRTEAQEEAARDERKLEHES